MVADSERGRHQALSSFEVEINVEINYIGPVQWKRNLGFSSFVLEHSSANFFVLPIQTRLSLMQKTSLSICCQSYTPHGVV
jgi:hypothetical protein